MQKSLRFIGGSLLGGVRASAPFVTLSVNSNLLTLSVFLIGKYKFYPHQVVYLEINRSWTQSVSIKYTLIDYPSQMIFLSGEAREVLNQIKQASFLPSALAEDIPYREGSPVRWQAFVLLLGFWSAITFLSQFHPNFIIRITASYSAFLFMFASSILIRHLPVAQELFVKPGRRVGECAPVLSLFAVISGALLVGMTVSTKMHSVY